MLLLQPRSTLFPYTTLFRSLRVKLHQVGMCAEQKEVNRHASLDGQSRSMKWRHVDVRRDVVFVTDFGITGRSGNQELTRNQVVPMEVTFPEVWRACLLKSMV